MAKVNVVVRVDTAAPATNNVPCSGLTLALNLDDEVEHDEADASCMFWLRRTSTAAQWIDFAFKRIIYVAYPEIYSGNLSHHGADSVFGRPGGADRADL